MLVISVVVQGNKLVTSCKSVVSVIVIFVNIGRNAPKQPVMIATLFLKLSIFRNDSDTKELMQKLAQLDVASPCQRLMLLSPVSDFPCYVPVSSSFFFFFKPCYAGVFVLEVY